MTSSLGLKRRPTLEELNCFFKTKTAAKVKVNVNILFKSDFGDNVPIFWLKMAHLQRKRVKGLLHRTP
jgi:hypothetical protein